MYFYKSVEFSLALILGLCMNNSSAGEQSCVLGGRFSLGASSRDFRKGFFVLKNWEINDVLARRAS